MNERSLGDPVEHEMDPSTYDVQDFAHGVRPGRRTVQIRQRLDLYPDLEDVVRRLDDAADDDEYEALRERFYDLKSQMLVTWVVERRSSEWRTAVYEAARESIGITGDKGVKDAISGEMTEAQALEVSFHIIAGQTVQPEGITVDDVRALFETDPTQVDALTEAVQAVNAGHAEALTLDFSPRRSTSQGTRRSSTS